MKTLFSLEEIINDQISRIVIKKVANNLQEAFDTCFVNHLPNGEWFIRDESKAAHYQRVYDSKHHVK